MQSGDLFIPSSENEILRPEVLVVFPTPERDFDYLINRVLKKKDYYLDEGLHIGLPSESFIQEVAADADFETLYNLFLSTEYDPHFYDLGFAFLQSMDVLSKTQQIFPELEDLHTAWGFTLLPRYEITLSKYGPGSVIRDGTVVLRTNREGKFTRNPAHSVAREIVCTGIVAPIKNRFGLPRRINDRISDYIVQARLGSIFPDYGERRSLDQRILAEYFSAESILRLPENIERILKESQA